MSARGRRSPIRVEDSVRLSRAISQCANRGLPRIDFMREVSGLLLDFCGCDATEERLHDGDLHYRWEAARRPRQDMRFERVRWTVADDAMVIPALAESSDLEQLCRDVACRRFDSAQPFFSSNGSFWTGNTWEPLVPATGDTVTMNDEPRCIGGPYRSPVVIRFFVDDKTIGLLHLKSEQPDYFTEEEVDFYEKIAETLGLAVANMRAEVALADTEAEHTRNVLASRDGNKVRAAKVLGIDRKTLREKLKTYESEPH